MLSDIDQSELKPHEKVLRQLICNEDINTFILHILGLERVDIELLNKSVETNKKLQKPYFDILDTETLFQLPDLKINPKKKNVTGKWQKVDGLLQISESEDYENALTEAIEEIFPLEPRQDGAIPVTLLLPNSIEMEGDNLCGKESSWQFFNIDSANNHRLLIDDQSSFFGLRLFSVFQSLGLVQPLQKVPKFNNSFEAKGGGNKTFANIIKGTDLHKHFVPVSSEVIKKKNKKSKEEAKKSNEINKLTSKNDSLNLKLEKGIYAHNEDKLSAINKEIKDLNNQIKTNQIQLDEIQHELERLDEQLIVRNFDESFYYTLPANTKFSTVNTEFDHTLPALRFADTTTYTSNIIELDGNKPAKRSINRMRFMLAYLFSLTRGTAITIYLKPAQEKGLKAPILVLPKTWNELALAAKTHKPSKQVDNYFTGKQNCEVSRNTYLQAIYYDYWYKREELMRCIPTKTGLFWDVTDEKIIKK